MLQISLQHRGKILPIHSLPMLSQYFHCHCRFFIFVNSWKWTSKIFPGRSTPWVWYIPCHTMLSQYFVMHSVRFIRVLFLIHMCLLNLQTCICLLYPTHSTCRCKERSPVLSSQYVWRVDMCFSSRKVDICWFHHFPIPPGRISDLFGRGREGGSLFSWREIREREIKSWTDIISWIFTNQLQGCYIYYSVHRAIWVEGVWKFHADKGF